MKKDLEKRIPNVTYWSDPPGVFKRISYLVIHLFGGFDRALLWLNTPSDDLAGRKPMELIENGESDSVRNLLEAIAAGEPS